MKRLTIRLIVALVTFAVGVTAATVWYLSRTTAPPSPKNSVAAPPANEQQIPTVAFCDLVSAPTQYLGKMVRVRATIYFDSTGVFNNKVMYDPATCSGGENRVWVEFDPASYTSLGVAGKTLGNLIIPDKGPHWVRRAEIVAVGRLDDENKRKEPPINLYRFQFIVYRLEQAEPVARDVGWP
jgi:hypothetical protein